MRTHQVLPRCRTRNAGPSGSERIAYAICCPDCVVEVTGYTEYAEAAYLAGIHNDLHHGPATVAVVVVDENPPPSTSGPAGPATEGS